MAYGGAAAGDRRHPHRRGQLQLGAKGQLPLCIARRVPAQQSADGGSIVGGNNDNAALRGWPDQGGGIEPATDRVLPCPQVLPPKQRVTVEQQRRRVSARR